MCVCGGRTPSSSHCLSVWERLSSRMKVPLALFLSLALAMLFGSGAGTGSQEDEETTTEYYDYVTVTPDYDYNATFDYYYVTGPYESRNKASTIGRLTPELLLGLAVLQIWH